jgi:hypothetical protein
MIKFVTSFLVVVALVSASIGPEVEPGQTIPKTRPKGRYMIENEILWESIHDASKNMQSFIFATNSLVRTLYGAGIKVENVEALHEAQYKIWEVMSNDLYRVHSSYCPDIDAQVGLKQYVENRLGLAQGGSLLILSEEFEGDASDGSDVFLNAFRASEFPIECVVRMYGQVLDNFIQMWMGEIVAKSKIVSQCPRSIVLSARSTREPSIESLLEVLQNPYLRNVSPELLAIASINPHDIENRLGYVTDEELASSFGLGGFTSVSDTSRFADFFGDHSLTKSQDDIEHIKAQLDRTGSMEDAYKYLLGEIKHKLSLWRDVLAERVREAREPAEQGIGGSTV